MPASPPQLNLLVLRSANVGRTADFYEHLGIIFTRHAHGAGPEHHSAELSGVVFEIYPLTAKSQPTAGLRIGFRVDAIDATVATLSQAGATVVTAPADSEWGRRAVIKDLDGHIIELIGA